MANALGCLSALYGNILLLKTPYTLVAGHRKFNLELTKKLLSSSLHLSARTSVGDWGRGGTTNGYIRMRTFSVTYVGRHSLKSFPAGGFPLEFTASCPRGIK